MYFLNELFCATIIDHPTTDPYVREDKEMPSLGTLQNSLILDYQFIEKISENTFLDLSNFLIL